MSQFIRYLAAYLLFATVVGHAQEKRRVDQEFPVPAAASAEMQAAIDGRSWPDLAELPAPPSNEDAWATHVEQVATERADTVLALVEASGVHLRRSTVSGVAVHQVTPPKIAEKHEDRLFLYFHGGAYVYGNGDSGLLEPALIATRIGIPVLSVDYRMPPKHPFPAAVDDAVAVYRQTLESRSADSIIVGGTSAGGGLALAAVHQLRNLGLPLPAAIYAGTPWSDLTKTGDTLFTNERLDRVLLTYDGLLRAAATLYADGHDMKDPLLSPVYGNFADFPPTILTTGTRDMFLSDSARTHRKLRDAGVTAELHVFEGMSHAGYLISSDTPESRAMYGEIDAFIDRFVR